MHAKMKALELPINPCPQALAFAPGIESGFEMEAFGRGFADCLFQRQYNDGVTCLPTGFIVLVPPTQDSVRPMSWQESYRLGWLYALQAFN